ncbi:MAG: rhodanese-like domain-containing protein [Bacteroidota bacterium]
MRTLIPFAGLILMAALAACGSDKSADAKNGASSDSTMVGQQPVIPVEPVDSSLMSLSPKEFLKVIQANPNMPILDIRTPEAFKQGHINRAVNIASNDSLLINRIASLSRIHDYAIYCASGSLSWDIAQRMKAMNFKRVYHLKGGLLMWGETEQALQIN